MDLYTKIFTNPIQNWEDISWSDFKYSYAGIFGGVLIFPLVLLGFVLVDLFELVSDSTIEHRLQVSVQYTLILFLLFAVPAVLISFAVAFSLLGSQSLAGILILLGVIWIISYSVIAPALYYLIGTHNTRGIFKLKGFLFGKKIQTREYKESAQQMIVLNIVFIFVSVVSFATVAGSVLVPLVLLWYAYACGEIYDKLQETFSE